MEFIAWLLGQGALVSLVVQMLKRWPPVARYPKVAAAVLNLAGVAVQTWGLGTLPAGAVAAFLAAVAAQVASIGTYETVLKPAGQRVP